MLLLYALFAAVWSSSLWWLARCQDPSLNVPACSSQFDYQWSVNSKGQSPCQVAGYLGSVCFDGQFTIPALIPGADNYSLSSELQNNCTCSTVYYSALSACASCQGATYIPWAEWSINCSSVFLGVYPNVIPSGTAVPHWAYQSITSSATFNVTLAQQAGDLPESSAAASSTSTSSSSPVSSSTKTSGTPVATASTDSSNKVNAGAIAGGVVGGLALVCIIILAVIFTRSSFRRKTENTRSASPLDVDMSLAMPTPFTLHHAPKQYVPADPSTDPSSEISQSNSQHPREHYLSWSGTSARYSGIPEI